MTDERDFWRIQPAEEFTEEQLTSRQGMSQDQPMRALDSLFGNTVIGQEDYHQAENDTNHECEVYRCKTGDIAMMLAGKFAHIARRLNGEMQIADFHPAAQFPIPALDERAENLRFAKNLNIDAFAFQALFGIQIILLPLLVIADIDKRAHADQDHRQAESDEELGAL